VARLIIGLALVGAGGPWSWRTLDARFVWEPRRPDDEEEQPRFISSNDGISTRSTATGRELWRARVAYLVSENPMKYRTKS
jgi:hypothetical protein